MTGAELRAYRKAAGLTQVQLALLAGISRHLVSRWEQKPFLTSWMWAPHQVLKALGIRVVPQNETSTGTGAPLVGSYPSWSATSLRPWPAKGRAWQLGMPPRKPVWPSEGSGPRIGSQPERAAQARRRVPCGAKTRKGEPCRMLPVPGPRRCKHHGGLNTGPKTEEGRARIAEAQRRRGRQRAAEQQPGNER
jgi:hypothetical protein